MMRRMTLHDDAAYLALKTHDARFDGRLFVGVTSTGIYCRPVCRVRTPLRRNCRFFGNAASAEREGFRPCLRCRPELAPGLSLVDSSQALGAQVVDRRHAMRFAEDAPQVAVGHAQPRGDIGQIRVAAAACGLLDQLRRMACQHL